MDSPVILDTAPEFGRGIEMDRVFPGFPFDDDAGFGRRTDIRAHLDDLASRHPEFADHLLGPPWGDIPFHGTLRNRRRGSGTGSYQGHPDEDARSQASGSSAASAASGASGVSSHGEPEVQHNTTQPEETVTQDTRRNPIPQYGLRNTVDIGQHRHNMENPDKALRGQRSMSAPPENRQAHFQQQYPQRQFQQPQQFQSPEEPQSQQSQQQQTPQNQRFVSRVDITPQQQAEAAGKPPMSPKTQQPPQPQPQPQQQQPQPQQQQQKSGQQGNVRHIPIFVEGRDEPVIPRNVEEPAFPRQQQSPPQFTRQQQSSPTFQQTPPQFHRPSHFNQHFGNKQSPWPPQFQDHFYQQQAPFEQPRWSHSKQQQPPHQQHQQPQQKPPKNYQQQQHQPQKQQQHQQQKQQQQQQQGEQQSEERPEPVKLKQVQPKEPLEKVALVQKEVDSLADQVKEYNGNSRQDKQYMYLDEMLTRELIKLDDIETEGKENVRQARKVAIKTIQDCIGLLESKVPLPGQQKPEEESQMSEDNGTSESMETEQEAKTVEDNGKAIPLPAAPPSPTKDTSNPEDKTANQEQENAKTDKTVNQSENIEQTFAKSPEPTENNPATKDLSNTSMEVNQEQSVAPKEAASTAETKEISKTEVNTNTEKEETKGGDDKKSKKEETTAEPTTEKPAKSPKTPKKLKKTKKQVPVSEDAIPLPAPKANQEPTSQ